MLESYSFESGAVLIQIPQVQPHLVESRIARKRGYFSYPPQGLLYLSAVFRDLGIETKILDLNIEVLRAAQEEGADLEAAWQRALDTALDTFEQPFVAVSFMFDPTYPQLAAICRYIKANRPALALSVGGVGATADPHRLLEECRADMVFTNEGEMPLRQFYEFARHESETVPSNLVFRALSGENVQTQKSTGVSVDLDIRDQYEKLGIGDYYRYGSLNNFSRMRGVDVPYATILTRRGCRAHCTFCSVRNFNGRSVRVRDTSGVIDEMVHLWTEFGVRHFEWLDDDPLYDRDEALRLYREIARRLPDATWCANNGMIASSVTAELLEAMVASNCQGFTVGLESGNAEMLKTIRKPASLERFARFADLSKGYPQIFYIVNLILGLPGENFGQMLDSLKVGMRARLDWINLFNFQPLKNTDAFIAYAGMAEGGIERVAGVDTLEERGTTINYNPVRAGHFRSLRSAADGIITGWDVFDIVPEAIPDRDQMNEVWFTFNNLANFLRLPALFTDQTPRLKNAIRWLGALETAYPDNPSISALLYYLNRRLGERAPEEVEALRGAAHAKFAQFPYWQARDREFKWSAMLDNALPPIDPRAQRFLERHRIPMSDGADASAEAATRREISARKKSGRGAFMQPANDGSAAVSIA